MTKIQWTFNLGNFIHFLGGGGEGEGNFSDLTVPRCSKEDPFTRGNKFDLGNFILVISVYIETSMPFCSFDVLLFRIKIPKSNLLPRVKRFSYRND